MSQHPFIVGDKSGCDNHSSTRRKLRQMPPPPLFVLPIVDRSSQQLRGVSQISVRCRTKVNIDQDARRNVSEPTYMTILAMVLDAKCDKNCK